ncbi:ABC transporter ATP-binding protein uup [mine drainage metagenome]|uniref:ABC transporter ATP-binding protein uup n=1 Tax=mine drainage metagenome TaxID=410659 RepID=A0A1J5PY16_9ZZZZ
MAERAEMSGGRAQLLAERQTAAAQAELADAQARVERSRRLSFELPSSGLPAGRTVLAFEGVGFAYPGGPPLIADLHLRLTGPERVSVSGPNGSGKTSLIRLATGDLEPSSGQVVRGVPAALLDQRTAMLRDDETLAEVFRRLNPEASENTARAALARFLFRGAAADRQVGSLSGGERLRAALACVLNAMRPPQLLILDEPTNHLDLDAIVWLEGLLQAFRGAVVLITHDRAFLDSVATRIVELDRGALRSYPGNFAAFEARRAQALADEAVAAARADKLLAQEEAWIRQGVEARRTRAVGRVRRLQQLRATRAARREQLGRVRLELDTGDAGGRIVADLQGVHLAFGERTLLRDVSTTILRGDKVGVVGPNGAGKTTLLKLILGELDPDAGLVRRGTRLQVAYFDQMRAALDPDATLAQTISPGGDWIEIGGQRKHVIGYLGDFLFSPQRALSPVRSLSGGERNRLLLARLFARPANLLVLDEPTNDLDVETLELLEQLLQEFSGTVFLVSHDRRFLDNVVTSTLVAEGDGVWREYEGGVDDWLQQSRRRQQAAAAVAAAAAPQPAPAARPAARAAPPRVKLSNKEQRELEQLPQRIAELEDEQKTIGERLADADLYRREPQQVAPLQARLQSIDEELLVLLERWEALDSR